jgi:hypothetical protein
MIYGSPQDFVTTLPTTLAETTSSKRKRIKMEVGIIRLTVILAQCL